MKTPEGAFSSSADFYEALAGGPKRLEREAPLLLAFLDGVHGSRVADIACGTGIHALFFAESGAQVDAFDLADAMVDYARKHRPHHAISYQQGDMRRLSMGIWDLIVCLGNSLSLLENQSDLESVFSGVRPCLAPAGAFAVQILNYQAKAAKQARHNEVHTHADGWNVTALKTLTPQKDHTLLALNFFAAKEGIWRMASETAVLQPWTLEDLQAAARKAGLTTKAVHGAMDGNPFDAETSTDLVLLLEPA